MTQKHVKQMVLGKLAPIEFLNTGLSQTFNLLKKKTVKTTVVFEVQ